MSKSQGNITAPQEVIEKFGADILRIWVVASDYSEDLRIGPEILKHATDSYRRLRNTLRYLLGNLNGFENAERLPLKDMPELEQLMLHRLCELDAMVRRCCEAYDFHTMFTALHNFCAVELSAFYFDVRKDSLYCDPCDDTTRCATRTVLDHLYSCLTAWLAPIICFTAEEAWLQRYPDGDDSVHLRTFPDVPAAWRNDTLAEKWEMIRSLRRVVTGALEVERAAKRIGSSLEAHPVIYAPPEFEAAVGDLALHDLCITSAAEFGHGRIPADGFTIEDVPGVTVVPGKAQGGKCERCWKVLPEIGTVAGHDDLCGRCADAVKASRRAVE